MLGSEPEYEFSTPRKNVRENEQPPSGNQPDTPLARESRSRLGLGYDVITSQRDLNETWEKPTLEIRMNTIVTTCSLVLALITLLNASTKSEKAHLALAVLAIIMVFATVAYSTISIYSRVSFDNKFKRLEGGIIVAPFFIAVISVIMFLVLHH